jgi:cell division septation protein DedD
MSIISISQAVGGSTPETDPISPAAKQRQLIVKAFAGTMAFGLVLATLYLGARIATSRNNVHATAPVKIVVPVASLPKPQPVITPAPRAAVSTLKKQAESTSATVRRNVIPHPGEKYVQVAAFGAKAMDSYIQELESKGLRPLIAPGPSDGIYRILIGPYTNMDTLEQTRRTLQVVGMDSIVRAY